MIQKKKNETTTTTSYGMVLIFGSVTWRRSRCTGRCGRWSNCGSAAAGGGRSAGPTPAPSRPARPPATFRSSGPFACGLCRSSRATAFCGAWWSADGRSGKRAWGRAGYSPSVDVRTLTTCCPWERPCHRMSTLVRRSSCPPSCRQKWIPNCQRALDPA